jgi:glyoxylase-like metal-dependent hydrolase (beta-lactamase superfamily II)
MLEPLQAFVRVRSPIAALLMLGCASAEPVQVAPDLDLVPLADGVYGAMRTSPIGLAQNSNSLIVVGDSGVIVVDAQFTRKATLETLAAIRRVTRKPVQYVVNTHWHDDHLAGNQVYRDTFPDVQFVMQANTRTDVKELGEPNRAGTAQGAPPLATEYERRLALGLGVDSTPVSPLERESLESALRIMHQYLDELPQFRETIDGLTVQDHLTLGGGATTVELHWFGRGNTRGDLVAYLPATGIVASGDLIVAPVPFAFGSHPAEWSAALDSVAALHPRILVPGHGPVMRDLAYLREEQTLLREIVSQAAAAVARGDSLAAARRAITLDADRRAIAGDEKWMNYMFDHFFLTPAVAAAFAEAKG